MKRSWFVALSMLASVVVHAGSIEFKTKPPYSVDDTIVFSVVSRSQTLRPLGETQNLATTWMKAEPAGAGTFRTWYSAIPMAPGRAHIPGFEGNGETIAGIDLDIQPSDNTADVASTMKRLRDSGRPPVVVQVSVRPADPFVGEIVQIVWTVISENDVSMRMADMPGIAGARPISLTSHSSGMDAVPGFGLVHRHDVWGLAYAPAKAGIVEIPAVRLEGTIGPYGSSLPLVRHVPGQQLVVRATPDDLPVGPMTLRVLNTRVERNEVTFDVHIEGPSDAGAERPPKVDGRNLTYLLQPLDAYFAQSGQPLACDRVWTVKAHGVGGDATVHSVSFTSFDRSLGNAATTSQIIDRDIPKPAETPPPPDDAKENQVVLTAVAITDVVLLIAILVVRAACSV